MVSRDDVPTPDEAAEALYALPPQEFTARRDEFVAEAKAHGDRTAAKEIGGFRKPSTGAWLANRLVRERPDDVRSLLDLGASLREAQSKLRGEELRELAKQRRQAVNALVRESRHSAAAAGMPVGDDIARQLEQTLEAALSSDDAAQLLASGRLVSALTPTAEFGSFPPQLRVVRQTEEESGRRKAAASGHSTSAAGPKKKAELAKARERVKAAEGAATDARRELADRGSQIDKIVAGLNEHESTAGDLQAEIDELSEKLRTTKERLTDLRRAHQEARRALTAAERETRAADRRVEAARAELDELE